VRTAASWDVVCGGSGSRGSSLTVSERGSLSRSASNFDAESSHSRTIVDVEACTIEGTALVSAGAKLDRARA
jgi:hypothetical protein